MIGTAVGFGVAVLGLAVLGLAVLGLAVGGFVVGALLAGDEVGEPVGAAVTGAEERGGQLGLGSGRADGSILDTSSPQPASKAPADTMAIAASAPRRTEITVLLLLPRDRKGVRRVGDRGRFR